MFRVRIPIIHLSHFHALRCSASGAHPSTSHAFSTASSSSSSSSSPRVFTSIQSLQSSLSPGSPSDTLGFVPTMGALHAGHLELVRRSTQENKRTVVSIFVNPTQFGPNEDFHAYPRTLEADLQLLSSLPVTGVFAPSASEMYGSSSHTRVIVDGMEATREGAIRPGHFTGVTTVVNKLLNIVSPSRAYFGQKDGMQCMAITRMARDLNMRSNIVIVPTIRAHDGLALSSRNVYLSQHQRANANVLFNALSASNDAFLSGERNASKLLTIANSILSRGIGQTQYVIITSSLTGQEMVDEIKQTTGDEQFMMSMAYKIGSTRLIDNCILGLPLVKGK